MTMDGGGHLRRWLGAWLLLVALGMAAATGYGIIRLNDDAAERAAGRWRVRGSTRAGSPSRSPRPA